MMSPAFGSDPDRSTRPRAPKRTSGFTLIELMVALMLAAIVSMSIMMISSQARLAYEETVKKVDVYNRFRFALQQLENDFKNWIPTGDLEFYQDGSGRAGKLNSHWDPGEEVSDVRDAFGLGVRDGGTYREYDEFAFIEERHYKSREPDPEDPETREHAAFRAYFQTMTYVDGAMRLANVEYYLADPKKTMGNGSRAPGFPTVVEPEHVPNLSLIKVVRYYEITHGSIQKVNETPVKRRVIEVATNVTDFRVEYTVDPQLEQRRRSKSEIEFFTPESEYKAPFEVALKPERIESGVYRRSFGYGSVKLDQSFDLATAEPDFRGDRRVGLNNGRHAPVRVGFKGNTRVRFAQLVPGDRIFLFTEGNRAARAQGGGGGGAGLANLVRFSAGDYTVKTNLNGLLELEEDIDSTEWGGQTQSGILYKAPFLPSAVRITMRIVDDKGLNPKTLQKTVWLRRRSR